MNARLARIPFGPTPRLCLEPLHAEDAVALVRITNDRSVTEPISFFGYPFTKADAERLIAGDGNDLFLGLRLAATGELVGALGMHLRGLQEIEIGYWVASAHQGAGYASEAVAAVVDILTARVPERRLYAECRRQNAASWRVLEKAGFRATRKGGARPGRERLDFVRVSAAQ